MADRKGCIRCNRAIDRWARICPFCNWDQEVPTPRSTAAPPYVTDYVPPEEYDLKKKGMMLGTGVLLLVAAFFVGMIINRSDAPKHAPETREEQAAEHNVIATRRADTPLIPTNEPGGYGQPITSAPATTATDGAPNELSRTDATAVSAVEYEQLAKRARAEKERMTTLIDPRTLTGPAYVPRPRPAPPSPPATEPAAGEPQRRRVFVRTRPIPQYQPVPPMNAKGTARLTLLIGADGRVKQVDIERALRGNAAELLAAVHSWRFKPATENGEAVAAPYSVEISFVRE